MAAGDRIEWTEGDKGRVLGVVLTDDGVAVDLTGVDAIECHQRDRSTGTLTTISGLTGDANGAVSTAFVGPLVAGTYTLEWQTTADSGATIVTYPGKASDRPLLIVRQEAD